jgi:hypothetical protein
MPKHGLILLVLALVPGISCRDAAGPGRTIASITLTGASAALVPNATLHLTAVTLNADGNELTGKEISWTSDDATVASVSASGFVQALAPGVTTIRATSEGVEGVYALSVAYAACTPLALSGTLEAGQMIVGTFTHAGCARGGVGPFRGYMITIASAATIGLDITSPGGTSQLILTTLAGDEVATAVSPAPGLKARTLAHLQPGSYLLWATAGAGHIGGFTLRADDGTCQAADAASGPLALNDTISGELFVGRCLLPDAAEAQGWSLSLALPSAVRIDVSTSGFYPYITVTDSALTLVAWSAPRELTAGTLAWDLPAGNHLVWVTKIGPAFGSFSVARTVYAVSYCDGFPSTGAVAIGDTINAEIEPTDCHMPDERFADEWTLTVPSDTTVRIWFSSLAIPGHLYLYDAGGELLDQGKYIWAVTDAIITRALPAGRYKILATTTVPVWGPYTLSVVGLP